MTFKNWSSKYFTNNQQTVNQEKRFLDILEAGQGASAWAVWGAYESLALDIFKNTFDRDNIDKGKVVLP